MLVNHKMKLFLQRKQSKYVSLMQRSWLNNDFGYFFFFFLLKSFGNGSDFSIFS